MKKHFLILNQNLEKKIRVLESILHKKANKTKQGENCPQLFASIDEMRLQRNSDNFCLFVKKYFLYPLILYSFDTMFQDAFTTWYCAFEVIKMAG